MPITIAVRVNRMLSGSTPKKRLQAAEQDAVLDEEQHPAVEAHVLRDEERDDEEQRQRHRPAAEHMIQAVGDRVADQREQDDGERREAERPEERDVVRALEDRPVVRERRLPARSRRCAAA